MPHFLTYYYTLLFIINFLIFFSITITSSNVESKQDDFAKSITTTRTTEKTTHLHFYFQDILSGKNPTAVKLIGSNMYGFGTTFIIDDALTEQPSLDSKIIGRAQGMYSVASRNDLTLLMVVTFVLTEGEYNGSSISMFGRNHVMDGVREIPIVGGSGLFRFARGYALANTVVFNVKSGDATVEYNVFLKHSSDG